MTPCQGKRPLAAYSVLKSGHVHTGRDRPGHRGSGHAGLRTAPAPVHARVSPWLPLRGQLVLGATGWPLGGDARRLGQPPPAKGHPASALAARRTSSTQQPCRNSLLLQLGHALLGQHLTQPHVLVMHMPLHLLSPASASDRSSLAVDGPLRMALDRTPRICRLPYAWCSPVPHLWPPPLYGHRSPPAGHAG
jgi:hypothetical protein